MKTFLTSSAKTRLTLAAVIVTGSAVLLSACQVGTPATPQNADTVVGESQPSGFTTLTGTVQVQGTQAFLKHFQGTTTLQSYSVDLKQYSGQAVTVTGQFSGDELFVSEIQTLSEPTM